MPNSNNLSLREVAPARGSWIEGHPTIEELERLAHEQASAALRSPELSPERRTAMGAASVGAPIDVAQLETEALDNKYANKLTHNIAVARADYLSQFSAD